MTQPHLIVLGGFLGAGKTSGVVALSGWLADQGIRVACIANDQGEDLVDTTLLRAHGLATEEITGGCFCCRFDALLGAASRLGAAVRPDVIVAEAVGSCTDLAATVTAPMRRMVGDTMTVAPLSVVIDAVCARGVLGLDSADAWSTDVTYLYIKQIEEADLLVLNKCDLLPAAAVDELLTALRDRAPSARIFPVSVRHGSGLQPWFTELLYGAPRRHDALDIDYHRYAAGEARLGWLNAGFDVRAASPRDGDALLLAVMRAVHQRLREQGVAIAHLKMTLAAEQADNSLSPSTGRDEGAAVAAIQLTATARTPEVSSRLARPIDRGRIIVNLRAEASPTVLDSAVRAVPALIERNDAAWRLTLSRLDAFQPAPPVPTHRDA